MFLFRLLLAITLAWLTVALLTTRMPPSSAPDRATVSSAPDRPQLPVGALAFAAAGAVLLLGRGGTRPPR